VTFTQGESGSAEPQVQLHLVIAAPDRLWMGGSKPTSVSLLRVERLSIPSWYRSENLIRALLAQTREYDNWLVGGDAVLRPLEAQWTDVMEAMQADPVIYGITDPGGVLLRSDDGGMGLSSVGDLRRAEQQGLIAGPWNTLLVYPPPGRGNGHFLFDWARWALESRAFDWIAGAMVSVAVDRLSSGESLLRSGKRLKQQARDWLYRGISAPADLRNFIDRKTAWSSRDLGTKLGIEAEDAAVLLTALGYDFDEQERIWRRSTSPGALRRRIAWENEEGDFWESLWSEDDDTD
jgi:hypothetical protein